jgi:YVTN family beta-propeller protein
MILIGCRAFVMILAAACTAAAQETDQQKSPAQKDQPFYTVKSTAAPKPVSSISQQFEKEGITIDFLMRSQKLDNGIDPGIVAGADAVVSFQVKDKRTGLPVTGLRPSGWISLRNNAHAPNESECKDKIRTFMGGMLSARADIDLNSYSMLTLNHDNTVTFINPQISFSVTKLESIVTLPGAGADWALSKNRDSLYVTLPQQSAVAVINTVTRKLTGTIATGEKTKPVRISLQPDGRYVWVGLDDSSSVAVIDTKTNKLAATITVGAGLHGMTFTPDSRFAYVTNSAADTVTVIDARALSKISDISVGKTPVPVAYSSASRSVYVAAINGATISVINPDKQQVSKTIAVKKGVVALRFDPSGRFGFAVNQLESTASVIDAATNSIVAEGPVVKGPDQVSFTGLYAYVRGIESEKFSLIDLKEAAKGNLNSVDIQAGRLAASTTPQEIGVADMIQPTPDGNSVMIANTPDQMIYYYVEGMMVPMGTFQNYKRRPHALLLIDRSLAETEPGVYSLPIRLRRAGTFDVSLIVDQPRIVNCFEVTVADSPLAKKVEAAASTLVEPLFKGMRFRSNEPVALRFKITDSITKQALAGLKDVQVLAFEPPGVWQQRQWASEVGDGVYELKQVFPHEGMFRVMVQIESRGLKFASLPATTVPVLSEAKKEEGIKNE